MHNGVSWIFFFLGESSWFLSMSFTIKLSWNIYQIAVKLPLESCLHWREQIGLAYCCLRMTTISIWVSETRIGISFLFAVFFFLFPQLLRNIPTQRCTLATGCWNVIRRREPSQCLGNAPQPTDFRGKGEGWPGELYL